MTHNNYLSSITQSKIKVIQLKKARQHYNTRSSHPRCEINSRKKLFILIHSSQVQYENRMHYFKLCKSFIILFITYLHTCVEELNFQIIPHSGTRIDQTLHSKLKLKCIGVNLHYFRKKQAMSLSLFVAKEIVLTIFFRLYYLFQS